PKELIEERQGHTAGATRGEAGSAASSPVDLCVLEFVKEPILENVNFVDVLGTPGIGRPVTNITGLESRVLEDLLLDTEIPLMNISGLKVWISRPETTRPICHEEIISISDRHLERREDQRYAGGG